MRRHFERAMKKFRNVRANLDALDSSVLSSEMDSKMEEFEKWLDASSYRKSSDVTANTSQPPIQNRITQRRNAVSIPGPQHNKKAVVRRPKAKRRSVVLIDIGNQIEPNHEEQHQQIDPIPPPPEFADDPTPSVDIQQCPNCDVVIRGRYPSDLARHMKCHEPRQQCSRCEKMLALRSFKLHANKCVAVASPRFACADCDKSYATAKLLATHRRGKH